MTPDALATAAERRRRRCALCALGHPAGRGAGPPAGATEPADLVAVIDDELVTLRGSAVEGVVLALRCHGRGLPADTGALAVLLAGLRSAVAQVRAAHGAGGATVEPVGEVRGAGGHACYHVAPGDRGDRPEVHPRRPEGTGRVAAVLGERLTGRRVHAAARPPHGERGATARPHRRPPGP